MEKLRKIYEKASILDKIFGIYSVVFIICAILSAPFDLFSKISLYLFNIWTMFFLFYMMYKIGKMAKIEFNKKYISIIGIAVLLMSIIYVGIINYREYVYTWDNITYYKNQLNLMPHFEESFGRGIKEIVRTVIYEDYNDFLLSFTTGLFSITNQTPEAFNIIFYFVGMVPTIILFLMIVKKIIDSLNVKKKLLIFGLSALFLISFWPLHGACLSGQPDIIGMIFIGFIILLTIDYDFSYIDWKRWMLILGSTFCLIITRRWYMFFALGYFVTYALVLLIKVLIGKDKEKIKNTISNGLKFAIVVGGGLLILSSPIIIKTLKNNYQSSYTAWDIGGLDTEFVQQFKRLGLIYFIIITAGAFYGIINKKLRYYTITLIGTWIIAIVSFTRIQNMGPHQMLILVPTYILLFVFGLIAIINGINKKKIQICTATLLGIIMALNLIGGITNNKYLYNNLFFTNMVVDSGRREDYKVIGEMVEFVKDNCNEQNKIYLNAATGDYSSHMITNYNLPSDRYIYNYVPYSFAIDSTNGFPEDILECKYIWIANQVLDDTGAKKGHIIPNINYAITEDKIISPKFKMIKEFRMTEEVTFYTYERVEEFNEEERQEWLKLFEGQSKIYPELFRDRILDFQVSN